MNNFFSLVLFSAVIRTRRGMKLMGKIIKYKLDSSSRMQFAFLYPKDIKKKRKFGKLSILSKIWKWRKQEGSGVMFFTSLWRMRTKIDKNSGTFDWRFEIFNSKFVQPITFLYGYKRKLTVCDWNCGKLDLNN